MGAVACVNTSDSHFSGDHKLKRIKVRVLSTGFTDLFTLWCHCYRILNMTITLTVIGTDGAYIIDLASAVVTPKELLQNFQDVHSSELWDAPDILREMYPEPWLRTLHRLQTPSR